ncbi:MAG: cytochrome-c peroxidase [Flavobacteriales bacterium]|nr:cytochrome-c peroxidase [Flavobacteriales bacterium]
MKTRHMLWGLTSVLLIIIACGKDDLLNKDIAKSPEPQLPDTPYDYKSTNNAKATLGRVLFYEKALSLNNTVSCGSCHKQTFGFADNTAVSKGLEGLPTARNTSSLLNDNTRRFWDNRAADFDEAVLQPVQNHTEMFIFDLSILPEKLGQRPYYGKLFKDAYGDEVISVERIQRALSFFLGTMNATVNIPLRYSTSPSQFTALEHEGRKLFIGKAKCSGCHTSSTFLSGWSGESQNIGLDIEYKDNGVGTVINREHLYGSFKVPSLLNISRTAPYMHDGRFATLREVIDHYNEGIQPHPNLAFNLRKGHYSDLPLEPGDDPSNPPPIRLGLTEHEKQALEAFLKTMVDQDILTSPRFSDPFRN